MCSPSWATTKSKHIFKQQLPSHGHFCAHQPMSDFFPTNETTRPCTAKAGAFSPNLWQSVRLQNLARSQNWSPVSAITEGHSFYHKLIIFGCIVLYCGDNAVKWLLAFFIHTPSVWQVILKPSFWFQAIHFRFIHIYFFPSYYFSKHFSAGYLCLFFQ